MLREIARLDVKLVHVLQGCSTVSFGVFSKHEESFASLLSKSLQVQVKFHSLGTAR